MVHLRTPQPEHPNQLLRPMERVGDDLAAGKRDGRSRFAADEGDEELAVGEGTGVALGEAPQGVLVLRTGRADADR